MISQFFNALKIISYNAIFTFIITNRNYGKTWSFKKRAFVRGLKRKRKTVWIRLFRNEKKEACASMYSSSDLQKYCGIIPYDPDNKTGNFKQIGNTFYCRKNEKEKWRWFLKIYSLSDRGAVRSADDVKCDTIVFDEFTTTPDKLKQYHGNMVSDFIDIFISAKRTHIVRCFFLGNKENVLNPFLTYFNVPQLPSNFEGIRTYRNGSIAIQQINNLPPEQTEYDKKLKSLLVGTTYGDYLYSSQYKNELSIKTKKAPSDANTYIQLCIDGYELSIKVYKSYFYVTNKIDKNGKVYTIEQMHKYKNEYLLVKRQKQLLYALIDAVASHRIYYNNIQTFNAIQSFYKWLNI